MEVTFDEMIEKIRKGSLSAWGSANTAELSSVLISILDMQKEMYKTLIGVLDMQKETAKHTEEAILKLDRRLKALEPRRAAGPDVV